MLWTPAQQRSNSHVTPQGCRYPGSCHWSRILMSTHRHESPQERAPMHYRNLERDILTSISPVSICSDVFQGSPGHSVPPPPGHCAETPREWVTDTSELCALRTEETNTISIYHYPNLNPNLHLLLAGLDTRKSISIHMHIQPELHLSRALSLCMRHGQAIESQDSSIVLKG